MVSKRAVVMAGLIFLGAIAVGLGIGAGVGALIMVVWNAVAVPLGMPALSFWVAWAMWALAVLVFRLVGTAVRGSKCRDSR